VEKAESWAKAQGAEMVIVNTHELMEQVHTVYRKLGYENLGRLEKYYGNGGAVFFGKKVAREGNGKIYS
jgi:ribosomal protein S18 acetylase RimI-like enzyme